MSQPADRARRVLGVGERVRLTFSLGNAAWNVTAGDGRLSSAAGASVVLRAPETPQTITVNAVGGGCSAEITFNVIAPSEVRMSRLDVMHIRNSHSSGMHTRIFFLPDTVNFHRVEWREDEIGCRATGVYACQNGQGHFPNPNPLGATSQVSPGRGTRMDATDSIWSGWCAPRSTMGVGRKTFRIPWRYRVEGASAFHSFDTVNQVHTSSATGILRSTKAGARTPNLNHGDAGEGVLRLQNGTFVDLSLVP